MSPPRRSLRDALGRMPASRQRRHVTVVAAIATVLAALPLSAVFERWTWLVDASIVVTGLCATALVVRALRAPVWTSTVAMIAMLPVLLGWLFPSHAELAGFLPSVSTLRHFNDLLATAGTEMRQVAAPVEDRQGFLFLATLGVGGVAVIVDLLAAVLRRPAMAGLPMLAVYSVPVAISEGNVNIVPFALGVVGFLWLLVVDNVDRVRRFGRRFSGEGRDIEMWEPSPLAAAGQRLGLIGIVLAISLPLFVPGMTDGLLNRLATGGAGGTGGGAGGGGKGNGQVSLYALLYGNLRRDRAFDMLRVTTTEKSPYYLRFAVADQLSPDGFRTRTPTQGRPVTAGLPQAPAANPGVNLLPGNKATVEILDVDMQYLPIYQQPTKLTGLKSAWLYDPATSVVYSTKQSTTRKMKYTVEYTRADPSVDALRGAEPLDPGDTAQREYTFVPKVTQVADLVDSLTEGKKSQYDKVMALFNYFSPANGFSYSVSTGPDTTGTKIVDFLFHNKRGFCVQYSAAMAWLVRQADVPARVAFGFTRGPSTEANKPSVLTNFNLHAWTEVYFAGYGWVPFDPTPATGVTGSVSPAWAPNPARPSDASNDGVGDAADPRRGLPAATAQTQPGQTGAGNAASGGRDQHGSTLPAWLLWTALTLLAALVVLAMPSWRRHVLRRRRLRSRDGPEPGPSAGGDGPAGEPVVLGDEATAGTPAGRNARAAWDELLDTMIDFRIPVDDTESPRMTAERLIASPLPERASSGVRVLRRAVEYARYARRPVPSPELASSVGAVRSALAARVSRRTRLRAFLLPPSITQRWRDSLELVSANAVAAVSSRRDALARAVHYRRLFRSRRPAGQRPPR